MQKREGREAARIGDAGGESKFVLGVRKQIPHYPINPIGYSRAIARSSASRAMPAPRGSPLPWTARVPVVPAAEAVSFVVKTLPPPALGPRI